MTIPADIITDIMTSTSSIFDACRSLVLLIFGVGLVFFIARNIQTLLPSK
jgi:hypothetical protein